jgi:predicted phage tail protein
VFALYFKNTDGENVSPAKSNYNLRAGEMQSKGLCLGWLGAVGGATALSLAAVLGLAAVVTGFTAAGSLALVFALAGVFVLVGLVQMRPDPGWGS